MFEVLDSARKVAEESRHVMIDKKALTRFCRQLPVFGMEVPPWENSYHFYDGAEKTVSYLLVLDSLNFCFWPAHGEKKWEIEYDSEKLSGYYALAASLKNAVERGIPITNAVYLAELSLKDLKRILSGSGRLQLLEKRVKILNELGRVLVEDFHGKAESLVGAASHSAGRLARLLADKLISFQDVAKYKGKKVFFYKRAQIFAADLHATFKGKDWGRFKDMGGLTAFADYKVPQVLRHLGILHYDHWLAQRVDQEVFIRPGSPEEVEIRASNIWAIELIRRELALSGKDLKAFEIDWILWNLGQDAEFKVKPYHRTLTIFY